MKTPVKWALGLGLPLLTAAAFLWEPSRDALLQAVAVLTNLDIAPVRDYLLSFGFWAPFISFLLMILQSVAAPLPAFLLTFANAALFGWFWGAVLSWTSAMAGAALCFWLARFYGRGVVSKLTTAPALESIDKFFGRYGNNAVLIARLLPFISFDLVSYAAGLTPMGWGAFLLATGLGQLPATVIYSIAGENLTGGAQTFVYGLFIVFALGALSWMLKRWWSDRKKAADAAPAAPAASEASEASGAAGSAAPGAPLGPDLAEEARP